MKKLIAIIYILFLSFISHSQTYKTPFETSGGTQTATYFECIKFYQNLESKFNSILIKKINISDAGYPLHLILFSRDKNFDIKKWQKDKIIILVNNGIHPGEPDGIDASMMILRDLAMGKVKAPNNVAIAFIALYNIGGALNRNSFTRVNQQGPESYGFRGNAQNLDLNRDFIKNDSKNAKAFSSIFHYLKPDIFIDNHVSDGADYQHTMTLLSTQHNKLGGPIGEFLHKRFEPAIYKSMAAKNDAICPYVNFEEGSIEKGWNAFYDPPRYSTGYTALFNTIGFMPETHMLKPFRQRVMSTYNLMETMLAESSKMADELREAKKKSEALLLEQTEFALRWVVDSSRHDKITFHGYEASGKISAVTGFSRLFYDHSKPFTKEVSLFNYYKPAATVTAPAAYIIPKGWHSVIDILKNNNVIMRQLLTDTSIMVEWYRIEDYKSLAKAYEKHHRNYAVVTSSKKEVMKFLKGDYIVMCNQPAKRYLVEVLEPTGEDGFFAWNFFDAILQQKEGYSDYRWEDVAEVYLKDHPQLKQKLEEKKKLDTTFAASPGAQLNFVYKNSPYYEPAHLRYPVYRLVK